VSAPGMDFKAAAREILQTASGVYGLKEMN
jgi:hypothetical protein